MSSQVDIGERMTIGELARRTGMPTSKIRYYEKVGVLPPSQRTDSNYRVYDASAVARLELLRRGKVLGLSLSEVGMLVEAAEEGCCDTTEPLLVDLVRNKRDEIDRHIKELQALRTTLTEALGGLQATGASPGVLGADWDCRSEACATDTNALHEKNPGKPRTSDRTGSRPYCAESGASLGEAYLMGEAE